MEPRMTLMEAKPGTHNLELDEHTRQLIAGAVAEVDPRQIAIYRRLTPAQRVWQLASLSDWLRQANRRRVQRQRKETVQV
ncbi:MAG: hypothetical protein JW850_10995 [Thermoflexales bacterium]|nr:hypothetical protein [Thermoflexales bacterium]